MLIKPTNYKYVILIILSVTLLKILNTVHNKMVMYSIKTYKHKKYIKKQNLFSMQRYKYLSQIHFLIEHVIWQRSEKRSAGKPM